MSERTVRKKLRKQANRAKRRHVGKALDAHGHHEREQTIPEARPRAR